MSRPLKVLAYSNQFVKYAAGLQLQEQLVQQLHAGNICDTLVLLQHSPVYTLGKRGSSKDFRVPIQELQEKGIDVHHVPRGGQVTYHGPGQLVAYPIVSLRSSGRGARAWVEGLEDVLVATTGAYGVHARGRVPGATGVWVEDRKIAAIGVKISHGISSHGVALNIDTELSAYGVIVPCGIEDRAVTSLRQELARGHARTSSTTRLPAQQASGGKPATMDHTPHSSTAGVQGRMHIGSSVPVMDVGEKAEDRKAAIDTSRLPDDPAAALRHVGNVFLTAFCREFDYCVPGEPPHQHLHSLVEGSMST